MTEKKFRCPYCKAIIGLEPLGTCPHCGKAIRIPDHLRATKFHERKKARERIVHQGELEREAIGLPAFRFGRKPSNLFLAVAMLVVAGGLLLSRVYYRAPTIKPRVPEATAARAVRNLKIASERFQRDCGRYPTDDEGLKALWIWPRVPDWGGPYITLLKPDPWGNDYQYVVTNSTVVVFSCGPDRIEGTPDDVVAAEPTAEEVMADLTVPTARISEPGGPLVIHGPAAPEPAASNAPAVPAAD